MTNLVRTLERQISLERKATNVPDLYDEEDNLDNEYGNIMQNTVNDSIC